MPSDSPAVFPAPLSNAAALITAFLAGRNARTLRAYRQDLLDFAGFVGGAGAPEEAARQLLGGGNGAANALALAYRAHLRDRGLQAATINRRLAALRSLVKLARTLGQVPWSLDVENVPSQPYRDTRGPGREGFRRLLSALGGDTAGTNEKTRRDRAIVRLLYDLGLRRGEVVTLDVADLDLEQKTLRVVGKGRTQKVTLDLADATASALGEWLAVRGGKAPAAGPLFISFDPAHKGDGRLSGFSVYRIIRALGERAGITVRPHGLRHAAITEACIAARDQNIALEEVLDFSRHKDVKTLMIYRDRERNVQKRLSSLIANRDQ